MAQGFDDYKIGSWVEMSTSARGKICDFKWTPSTQTYKGQIVGFDSSGYPILYFPSAPSDSGVWGLDKAGMKQLGVQLPYLASIPEKTNCLYAALEPGAMKKWSDPVVEKMKHNLKVGDRIVVGTEKGSSTISTYGLSDGLLTYSATVVGQKADGSPILYFDSYNAGFMWAWEYNYGNDKSMLDPSWKYTINTKDRKLMILEDKHSFLSEKDWNAGKRIATSAMPMDALITRHNILSSYDTKLIDSREFIRNVANSLPSDESESHLFGEQFTSLFSKDVPRRHEVFVKTKVSSAKFANNLRNMFGDSSVIYNGTVDSVYEGVITEEYLVTWRSGDLQKQYKVHASYAKNGDISSVYENGGVDANAFQMFRKDQLIKNAANNDINDAIKNVVNKQLSSWGSAKAINAIVDELTKKDFISKVKGKKKMATTKNDSNEQGFLDMMVGDFHEAKFRVAADQTTHLIKEGLVKALNAKGGDSAQVEILKMMLDSDGGEAVIAWMAGIGLTYGPGISQHPSAKRFAKEFRVNGQAKAGNLIAETLMGTLLPILGNALSQLPAEEQLRVAEKSVSTRVNADANEEEDEQEETQVEGKKAVA